MLILPYVRNDGRASGVSGNRNLFGLSDRGGGFFFADYPAIFGLDDAVAVGGVALGVGDLKDGGATLVEALEELHDLFALRGVQVSGGLVGENELGILNHRARHSHELLLSAGKLIRKQVFLPDDVETIKNVADQAHALFVRNIFVGERDFEIFEDRKIVDQVVALENEADIGLVQFVALLDVEFVDRLIEKIVFTIPRAIEHADNAEQRGFPRARRTHEGDELPLLNVDVDAAKHKEFAPTGLESLLEIAHLNQRFHKLSLDARMSLL